MARPKLQNRRAIVTGASSGIGRALAHRLASEGVQLLLTARREERLLELTTELNRLAHSDSEASDADVDGSRTHHFIAGDITDSQLRDELVRWVNLHWGGLDLLINNAGIGSIGLFADGDEDRLRRVMEVNFFAPVNLSRACAPLLARGERPMIVNVGSVLGHRGVPTKVEYCASKFAMHGFSDAWRAELVQAGIHVLLVSPSTTASEFFDELEDSTRQSKRRQAMSPDQVARKTIRAIKQRRHEIILSAAGKLLVWLDRLCPPLADRLVAKFG